MTPSPLQTAQDLRRSAQLVRTHGYARYNYVAEDGTLCAMIHKYVEAYHEKLAKSPVDIVYHYNDFICEGGEELALLLIQAAEKLEADLP
jgi:hypothetical protein